MDTRLKDNEWIILHAVWKQNPIDLKSIIRSVQEDNPQIGWDYKTYHSFLRILLDKGYLKAVKSGKNNLYSPGITYEEAMSLEADSLISRRNFYGSVSGLMINMAEQGKLTDREKQDLMELAKRLARGEV
ncbi:MAG: BlaI/MecI/CopY family transcriptional regulator [Clostridia bacterium]|jgi:predicted transcriptional regulator|nr:BlaI/MecI/CopY family transcriptional regulator [Clostridia bacterium]